ncbi:hypothetical protein BVRB_5g108470 [Beta vulgaris subsp. vulgaris]|nr:hypothetical protein BVRB_5g108470 [Beta vulgaris subsp. vulgaris]
MAAVMNMSVESFENRCRNKDKPNEHSSDYPSLPVPHNRRLTRFKREKT